MEKLIFSLIILLFVVAGLITFIKDTITAAKNPSGKQGSKYYVQDNSWTCGDTGNYHNSSNYFNSSCDSGSFDGGGDCSGGD